MFAPLLLLPVFVATLGQEIISTQFLGQRASRLNQPMSNCSAGMAVGTLTCRVGILGQVATVQFIFSDAASQNGDPVVLGWTARFANFTQRDRALSVLNPLLQTLNRVYPAHEQQDTPQGLSWYFSDPKRSVTVVDFVSSGGLEHGIAMTTRLTAFRN